MDRERYINDTSYREGYDDGRKEGSKLAANIAMTCLDKLSNDIDYIKKLLSDTFDSKEGGQ